eukprot:CAMPEP_0184701424 /NCGR_PEP_ID=MMETSP0313-20130426/19855_1 /TAXON_ID=2792 /ORGANISM="Porphyridium aerugineum, Strain SAG 1380-2" /LENGTH=203 /DNA_ID=CAMNT_0027161483 /DNA_START=76 /DNA_END=687 /DNA_ORIENTATION=+
MAPTIAFSLYVPFQGTTTKTLTYAALCVTRNSATAVVAQRSQLRMMAEEEAKPKTKFTPGLGVSPASQALQKQKLEPEVTFFEGKPAWTEVIIPFLSILTVVGIVPFIASVSRQFWVKYKITSRRIAIDGGFQGKDHVEIVYRDIDSIKYIRRMGGSSADMVFFLKDGAKLEMRSVPKFTEVYPYILERLPEDAKERCQGFNA